MVSSSKKPGLRGKSAQIGKQRIDSQSARYIINPKQLPLRDQANAGQIAPEKSYYGGESLWNKDVLQDISMVSYRATRMTTSVGRLFSEISPNARPLRREETRDLIYQKQAMYEADMLADFEELRRPRSSMSTSLGSSRTTTMHRSADINAEDPLGKLGSQPHNRSASKKAVVRDKLELFPRSRAGSKTRPQEADEDRDGEESAAIAAPDAERLTTSTEGRPCSTNSGMRARLFASDRPLARDEPPSPAVTFKRAFFYAKHCLSQWMKHA